MRRMISVLFATVLMSGIAMAEDVSVTEKKVADLEAALGQAMIHKDVATLSKLVADDWTMQSSSGTMGTKAGFIGDVRSGTLVVRSFKIHDMHVRVLGNVAFVQAFDDEETSYKGVASKGTYNWLDVWEKRDGQWVSLVTQLTKVETK